MKDQKQAWTKTTILWSQGRMHKKITVAVWVRGAGGQGRGYGKKQKTFEGKKGGCPSTKIRTCPKPVAGGGDKGGQEAPRLKKSSGQERNAEKSRKR